MIKANKKFLYFIILLCVLSDLSGKAQHTLPAFRVIAFFTANSEPAHNSFVEEANRWFDSIGKKYNFSYDSTSDWSKMTAGFLSNYQVVLFLNSRPDGIKQRDIFKKYMQNGGAWMGFHFAGFGLTPSEIPMNWDWYHNTFLGSGAWVSNTWRPTAAILRVENSGNPVTKGLPALFKSAPNEWYRWENDLRKNPDITILLSIDSSSFPLGTGPKPFEIWHSGYYPVVWTNKKYKMIYFNMGHNDIDFENNSTKPLSYTLGNEMQNKLIIDGLFWLVHKK